MAVFHIKTEDSRQLGFILFAENEMGRPAAGPYDCIFMGIPHDTSLFDDPRGCFVLDHRHQEWIAEVGRSASDITVHIETDSGWKFEVRGDEAGGCWSATRCDEKLSGTGNFLSSQPSLD